MTIPIQISADHRTISLSVTKDDEALDAQVRFGSKDQVVFKEPDWPEVEVVKQQGPADMAMWRTMMEVIMGFASTLQESANLNEDTSADENAE